MNQLTLRSLPASADSPLDSTQPDSEQSHSARSSRLQPPSILLSGQDAPTSETSSKLTAESFCERMDAQQSLREAFLASLQAHSDRCAELLTSVGFGQKQSDWFASFDPITQSLRTRQVSLFSKEGEHGTELCLNWSRAGMIVSGMYFPLPRLVRGISENVSSLFAPTPICNDGTGSQYCYGKDKKKLLKLPGFVKRLPTLVASDGTRGPDFAKANRVGSGSDDLVATMARLLPTCTARDYKDTPGMSLHRPERRSGGAEERRNGGTEERTPTGSTPESHLRGNEKARPIEMRDRVNGETWWHEANTGIPVLANGLSSRLCEDSARCFGNAIVPAVAQTIAEAIMKQL